jgi:hypothetical protein
LLSEAKEVDTDSRQFAKTIEKRVAEFCASLDAKLPAYSFIPLTTDEMRIKDPS